MIERLLFWKYDMAENTNLRYGKFDRFFAPGEGKLATSGSSTSIVTISSSGVLKDVKVGDLLNMTRDPYVSTGRDTVKITAKASNDAATVSSAVNWDNSAAGYSPWSYLVSEVPVAGTDSGWFHVGADVDPTINIQITTVAAAGGIDIQIEGKGTENGTAVPLFFRNYAAATDNEMIPLGSECPPFIRVGVKGGSGFAGTDVLTISYHAKERC